MLDGYLNWMAGKAGLVAGKIGVYDALDRGPRSAEELAKELKVSEGGVSVLLNVLHSWGYVKKQGDRYTNTKVSSKWLTSSSPHTIFATIHSYNYYDGLWERASNLEETIRQGKPPVPAWEWFEQHSGTYRDVQLHWRGRAKFSGDEIVSKVKLPVEARRLLDLGGGHGLYAIQFCRKNPQLSAVIFDLPQGIEIAEETIAQEAMQDRVTTQAGDFNTDDIGSNYDVVFLSSILGSTENPPGLLKKVFNSLNPGGMVVTRDFSRIEGRSGIAGAISSIAALEQFLSAGRRPYTFEEVSSWLEGAGFINLRRINFRSGGSPILGTKPGR